MSQHTSVGEMYQIMHFSTPTTSEVCMESSGFGLGLPIDWLVGFFPSEKKGVDFLILLLICKYVQASK